MQELAKSSNLKLTPCDLERALWCSEMQKKLPTNVEKQKNDKHSLDKEKSFPSNVGKQQIDESNDNALLGGSNKRRKRK